MTRLKLHSENHLVSRIGCLRAAVLGANDGIVSTASLIVGVAAAASGKTEVLIAGLAALIAGAMSMAAGEYVSVSSQADSEQSDLAKERRELAEKPEAELDELTAIYVDRGLTPELAREVAAQLMARDGLAVHAREELGISEIVAARPVQAALTSAATFAVGAALPLLVAIVAPASMLILAVAVATLVSLIGLGIIGAVVGGANPVRGAVRVAFWGVAAMAATAAVGWLFGTSVA